MRRTPILGAALLVAVVLLVACEPAGRSHASAPVPAPAGPSPSDSVAVLQDNVSADLVTGNVSYFPRAQGFLARPDDNASHPGIVMVHEWWGLNDNIRTMAKALAAQGYTVLAVDLYHGESTTDPSRAGALSSSVNRDEAVANMRAAAAYLRERQGSGKVASLGWCFGGGQSLALALSGERLDATVVYYGSPLVTDAGNLSRISWPVLGVFGSADTVVPVAQARAFNATLGDLGIAHEVYVYDGMGHAFANPSSATYASAPAQDAWAKTVAFLRKSLA